MMRHSVREPNRFYFMLVLSLALNVFLLPIVAGRWFWSSRAEQFSVEELHPAEVKNVTLHSPKQPPPPKPKPKPKIVPLLPPRRPEHIARTATKPKAKGASTPLRPHVMTIEGGNTSGTSAVTQGKGEAGIPTLPATPQSPSPPSPAPKGETRNSVATASPVPQIPDSLRSQVLKTFVRVRFDIASNGTFEVVLLTSSGSPELDRLTLESLREWRWKPAMKNGVPVPSTERLRIEFEVQ